MNWEPIIQEGKCLAGLIGGGKVDLNEAQKVLEFYVAGRYNDEHLQHFLDIMIFDPPQRSKKTEMYYRNLKAALSQWRTPLKGRDKALAWGWGIRIARSGGGGAERSR